MEFSRPEYCSGFPFPFPGDLPNPGIEPRSPALQADSLPSEPPGNPVNTRVGSLSLLQRVVCVCAYIYTVPKELFFEFKGLWTLYMLIGLPHSSVGKESACNAADPGSIPGLGRSTGEGIG